MSDGEITLESGKAPVDWTPVSPIPPTQSLTASELRRCAELAREDARVVRPAQEIGFGPYP